jgi:alcohol dehydrogenase YqhD (iron-dependent ADH family)
MENFTIYNPTTLHFGKDVIQKLANVIKTFGQRVLLVYGRESIKKNGIYDQVMGQLKSAGVEVFEYSGIKSNPIVEDVDAAARLGRENNVDIVLAVGGGSVIDSAKIISIAIPVQHSAWDFYSDKAKPQQAVPLIAVLTLAATGTEMNMFAVVQNHKEGRKSGYGHKLMYPAHSFLDPAYTHSVPADYTAYGIADLIAHCLENYFGKKKATLTDRFIFSIISDAVAFAPRVLTEPNNYENRAAIMYAATAALNGLTSFGKGMGDWGVHSVGHVLSLLFDIAHGASLTIVYPAWMKFHKNELETEIAHLGKSVFGTQSADESIAAFEKFFSNIGCPVSLADAGIGSEKKQDILESMKFNKVQGNHHKFTHGQMEELLDLML